MLKINLLTTFKKGVEYKKKELLLFIIIYIFSST